MSGTESTNARHRSSELARLCDSAAPHHRVAAFFDGIVQRRLAITATPTIGTRTAKNGGSADRESRGISSRSPSLLTLTIPVTARAAPMGQYPIGDAEQWKKIVENLGALVAELDRSLVPEIEALIGPTPEWYRPDG